VANSLPEIVPGRLVAFRHNVISLADYTARVSLRSRSP